MNFTVWGLWALFLVVLAILRAQLLNRGRLDSLFRLLGRIEIGVLALLLGGLVLLGCTQIVLRNIFHSGLLWADPLMRHIVLWLGCLGAALATVHLRHINIDVFSRLLPGRKKSIRRAVVYVATAIATFVLGIASLRLVADERAFGEIAFGPVKTWMLQAVMPFAFFLISYRSIVNMLTGREAPTGSGEHTLDSGRDENGAAESASS